MKLAVITTHPIQYNAPLFKYLANDTDIDLKVFYTWGEDCLKDKYDPGFGRTINWDIPLLNGYNYSFVKNISKNPGSHNFKGIDNPGIIDDIKEFAPDMLLVFGWNFKSHLRILRYFKGKVKILFRGDSTLLDENGKSPVQKLMRRFFLKWVYKHVDIAVYYGKANQAYYLKHGLKENQLVYAPHAVDNKRFYDSGSNKFEQKAREWRRQLEIADENIVFLFAGKLEPKKNPELLLQSFARIKEKNVSLVIVGNGELEEKLKKNYSGLPGIHFVDFQNQSVMPVVYRLGDVFVLPSKGPEETWGLSVNEAMACEKPVIVSSKCGCVYDIVFNDVNGYSFISGEEDELVHQMQLCITNKSKLKEMGQQSLRIIKEYKIESFSDAIYKIINQLAESEVAV